MPVSNAPAGAAPARNALHEAALRHLARFPTTRAGLVRVLERRIDRWLRRASDEEGADSEILRGQAAAARREAAVVADALVADGIVDDAAFAAARARRLARSGRSGRAIEAALARAGVAAPLVEAAFDGDGAAELERALLAARRKRLGPFAREPLYRDTEEGREAHRRALGALARAGFSQQIASQALAMDADEAETMVLEAKQRG